MTRVRRRLELAPSPYLVSVDRLKPTRPSSVTENGPGCRFGASLNHGNDGWFRRLWRHDWHFAIDRVRTVSRLRNIEQP
jgi:hypothetical protein